MLQVICIMALHSLGSIFTSGSQIFLLLPVAACILLTLVAVAIADSKCRTYMEKLDGRLSKILDMLQYSGTKYPNRFLQSVFLPMVISLPASPIVAFVLAVTTPWLLLILLVNFLANAIIIARYNLRLRQINLTSALSGSYVPINYGTEYEEKLKDRDHQGHSMLLPSYLLRDQRPDSGSGKDYEEGELGTMQLSTPAVEKLKHRKRQDLAILRSVYHGSILSASAILAVLHLASLGSIVGFFIIANNLRKALLSVVQFQFPSSEKITFGQSYEFFSMALLSAEVVEAQLESRYNTHQQSLQRFNQRYGQLIKSRNFLRMRNISLTHVHHGIQLERITARLDLTPCTIVRINNARLAHELRVLVRQLQLQRYGEWQLAGEILSGGQKLSQIFLSQLPLRAPWKIRVSSPRIEASFSPEQQERVLDLIQRYSLDHLLYGDDGFVADLASLSKRQMQRLRSLICLIILVLEPACLSVAAFALETFEVEETGSLIAMIQAESQGLETCNLLLTRRPLTGIERCPYYEIDRNSLSKLTQ